MVNFRRAVSGSGTGNLSVRESINVNGTRNLSERFQIGLGIRGYQTNALDSGAANFDERDYLQLRALFRWRFTRKFNIEFDYRYTVLDRTNFASEAESNRVNLWFRYTPILLDEAN